MNFEMDKEMKTKLARNYVNVLYRRVNENRLGDRYCDVEFRVGNERFKCHRLILASSSHYFHVMFNGNFKESGASEIELREIEASTFALVLRFIYTGQVAIDDRNLYDLIRANECYKIPYLEEACVAYVREKTTANHRLSDGNVFEMFSYCRAVGLTELVRVLGRHVFAHFDHFSRTTEFLDISLEDFSCILEPMNGGLCPAAENHDLYLRAIFKWVKYNWKLSSDVRADIARLVDKIDFANLSTEFNEYVTKRYFVELTEPTSSRVTATTVQCDADDVALHECLRQKLLHAYVKTDCWDETVAAAAADGDTFASSVFTFYRYTHRYNWIHSYSPQHRFPDFMRTVELNARLYCLDGAEQKRSAYPPCDCIVDEHELPVAVQRFKMCSSISLSADSYLKSPPVLMDCFDMCAMAEGSAPAIFVYYRNSHLRGILRNELHSSAFGDEELARAVYLYNTEVDKWLPVPAPKLKVANACMTCDERLVYLIGGTNSNKNVQCYDRRTPNWLTLEPTAGVFDRAACCAAGERVYVCGGRVNLKGIEMYDTVAGRWQSLPRMDLERCDHRIMVDNYGDAITWSEWLSPDTDVIEFFDVRENAWTNLAVPLYGAITNSRVGERNKEYYFGKGIKLLDIIVYKPYGF